MSLGTLKVLRVEVTAEVGAAEFFVTTKLIASHARKQDGTALNGAKNRL